MNSLHSEKRIVNCPSCGARPRIPANLHVRYTCPNCRKKHEVLPEKEIAQALHNLKREAITTILLSIIAFLFAVSGRAYWCMLPLIFFIVATASLSWIACIRRSFTKRSIYRMMIDGVREFLITLSAVATIYIILSGVVAMIGPTPVSTTTLRQLETAIAMIRKFHIDFLNFGSWQKALGFALLAAMVFIGLVRTGSILSHKFKKYLKHTRRIYVALTLLTCFTFFQSDLNTKIEAHHVVLNKGLDSLRRDYAALYAEAEAIAFRQVADGLADSPELSDVQTAYNDHANQLQRFDDIITVVAINFPDLEQKLRQEVDRGRWKYRDDPDIPNERDSNPSTSASGAGAPAYRTEKEAKSFSIHQDRAERVSRSSIATARTVLTSEASGASQSKLNPYREAVRRTVEAVYKETGEATLEQALVVEGVPSELVKLVIHPVLYKPLRRIVVDAVEKLINGAFDATGKKEGIKSVLALVRAKAKRLPLDQIRASILKFDARIAKAIGTAKEVKTILDQVEQRAAAKTSELERRYLEEFRTRFQFESERPQTAVLELGARLFSKPTVMPYVEWLIEVKRRNTTVANINESLSALDLWHALEGIEIQILSTSTLRGQMATWEKEVIEIDRTGRWGRVRARVLAIINNGDSRYSEKNIRKLNRIFQRLRPWQDTTAQQAVINGATHPHEVEEHFNRAFTEQIMRYPELAAVFGDKAERLIDPKAEERYYQNQIHLVMINDIIKSGRADNHDDASVILAMSGIPGTPYSGLYDQSKIAQVIRKYGMDPYFGVVYYFETSGTGTQKMADQIRATLGWERIISEICRCE